MKQIFLSYQFFFAKYDIVVCDIPLYLPDKIFKIKAVTFYFYIIRRKRILTMHFLTCILYTVYACIWVHCQLRVNVVQPLRTLEKSTRNFYSHFYLQLSEMADERVFLFWLLLFKITFYLGMFDKMSEFKSIVVLFLLIFQHPIDLRKNCESVVSSLSSSLFPKR